MVRHWITRPAVAVIVCAISAGLTAMWAVPSRAGGQATATAPATRASRAAAELRSVPFTDDTLPPGVRVYVEHTTIEKDVLLVMVLIDTDRAWEAGERWAALFGVRFELVDFEGKVVFSTNGKEFGGCFNATVAECKFARPIATDRAAYSFTAAIPDQILTGRKFGAKMRK